MSELPFESHAVVSSQPNSTVEEIPAKFPADFSVEDYSPSPPLPEPPVFTLGTNPEEGSEFSLADVSGVCLPGCYHLGPQQTQRSANTPPVDCGLYKVGELDYLASPPEPGPPSASDPGAEPELSEACKVPVYEVSDPRLDLATGQVHIHIDLSTTEPGQPLSPSSEVLATYYDMSSSVAMDDTESAAGHSAYPYFNGASGASSLASGTGSSSSSPYSLSNRAYSDPASAYNLYSQYYGAAYPYGMGGFGSSSSGSSGAGAGFTTKGEYGSYYGSYASWTGNPYR